MTDYMEYGDTNLIALPNGWFQDIDTGNKIDPEGRIYSRQGMLLQDVDDAL